MSCTTKFKINIWKLDIIIRILEVNSEWTIPFSYACFHFMFNWWFVQYIPRIKCNLCVSIFYCMLTLVLTIYIVKSRLFRGFRSNHQTTKLSWSFMCSVSSVKMTDMIVRFVYMWWYWWPSLFKISFNYLKTNKWMVRISM